MNTTENLILVNYNNKMTDRTKNIKICNYNKQTHTYDITFYTNDHVYRYNYNNVLWYKNPIIIAPSTVKVFLNHSELRNIKFIANFSNKYYHIIFSNGYENTYDFSEISIDESCLNDENINSVFNYLNLIADEISITTDDGFRILSSQYDEMKKFISNKSVASNYLSRSIPQKHTKSRITIFPFGSNASQMRAVNSALENQLSVIEGPPGTGKTQTILNIIANLVIDKKCVEIVSNNNSATDNIYEKLCKYGYGFIVAPLGKKDNKEKFIESQTENLPKMDDWKIPAKKLDETNQRVTDISEQLTEFYGMQEKLASQKLELSQTLTEQVYFDEFCKENNVSVFECKKKINSRYLMKLWEILENSKKKIYKLISYIIFIFCFGLKNRKMYTLPTDKLIDVVKYNFYILKIQELKKSIECLEKSLKRKNASELIEEYTALSKKLFNHFLYLRYRKIKKRKKFEIFDLRKDAESFVEEYPVVLSTSYSARNSLGTPSTPYIFDYVIMDEASQVDVSTGLIALSVAKNAVIVGDRKQLPNVITELDKKKTERIFTNCKIADCYNFSEQSFLSSICLAFPEISNILLREHYRCHPKIIEFCNKEFYDGQLLIMTKDNNEKDVLKVYKTVVGNHARGHINQRQVDVIINEMLPGLEGESGETGIIAPYRSQVNRIRNEISNSDIVVDTIHKFQGREKSNIIFSTVDNVITEFTDNPNMLNVAVSRAVKRFEIVLDPRSENLNTHIGNLVRYIEYNNFEIADSKIYSVFDCLYSQYQSQKQKRFYSGKKVSEYDSENLMYNLLVKIIHENNYTNLGIMPHLPLKEIFRKLDKLDSEELRFVTKTDSHVDFIVYSKVTKFPILAIEVDGYSYHHEGSRQSERDKIKDGIFEKYSLPLVRFSTIGSNEEKRLLEKLREII